MSWSETEIGINLGLENREIVGCNSENERSTVERIYNVLLRWKQQNGREATNRHLIHGLAECEPSDPVLLDHVANVLLEGSGVQDDHLQRDSVVRIGRPTCVPTYTTHPNTPTPLSAPIPQYTQALPFPLSVFVPIGLLQLRELENEGMKNLCSHLSIDNESIKKAFSSLERKFDSLNEENAFLKNENQSLKNDKIILEAKNLSLENENALLKNSINEDHEGFFSHDETVSIHSYEVDTGQDISFSSKQSSDAAVVHMSISQDWSVMDRPVQEFIGDKRLISSLSHDEDAQLEWASSPKLRHTC